MNVKKDLKIVLAHIYADDNKGDLGIIQSTVLGIRQHLDRNKVNSHITAMSMFRRADIQKHNTHRMLRTMVDAIVPSPVAQKYEEDRGIVRSILKFVYIIFALLSAEIKILIFKAIKKELVLGNLRPIHDADLVICKGGSLLHCNKSIRAHLFLIRMLTPLYFAYLLRRPGFILGQSIGPFQTSVSRYIVRNVAKRSNLFIVRDNTSLEYLESIGVPTEKLAIMPDIAFLLREFVAERKPTASANVLGVTALNVTRDKTAQHNYNNMLLRVISDFLEQNPDWRVRFIPQVIGPDSWQDDRHIERELATLLSAKFGDRVEQDERDLTPLELCEEYAKIRLLFGSRLHSTIFASVVNTPAIVIEYQQAKALGALSWLGRSDCVFHYSSPQALVSQALLKAARNVDADARAIAEKGAHLVDIINGAIERMFLSANVTIKRTIV